METKANPNPNGCLARALPHEPIFALLGRDPIAPLAIRWWAQKRVEAGLDGEIDQPSGQIADAIETADAFERWRAEHDGEWRDAEAKRAAKIERLARAIARSCSPGENPDLIWQAHADDAAACLAEIEAMEAEANG